MVKTKCEVYSRVVGYLRPIDQWNEGKGEEFVDRETFESANKGEEEKREVPKQAAKIAA